MTEEWSSNSRRVFEITRHEVTLVVRYLMSVFLTPCHLVYRCRRWDQAENGHWLDVIATVVTPWRDVSLLYVEMIRRGLWTSTTWRGCAPFHMSFTGCMSCIEQ